MYGIPSYHLPTNAFTPHDRIARLSQERQLLIEALKLFNVDGERYLQEKLNENVSDKIQK